MGRIFLILAVAVLTVGCGNRTGKKKHGAGADSLAVMAPADTVKVRNEVSGGIPASGWEEVVYSHSVAGLSPGEPVSVLDSVLPADHEVVEETVCFGEDLYGIYLQVYRGDEHVMTVVPDDYGIISSVRVVSPRYTVAGSTIHAGSTVKDMKEAFTVSGVYFTVTEGIYLFCEGVGNSFELDMEPEDYFRYTCPEDLSGALSDDHVIRSISAYTKERYIEMTGPSPDWATMWLLL